jgi:hypothetical protein
MFDVFDFRFFLGLGVNLNSWWEVDAAEFIDELC